jgi:hypothetical protein
MYEVVEISLGDLTRLYRYKLQGLYKANFDLKGFAYPWLVSSRQWRPGEKVLDVGAAYSPLPMHLQETYGCEVWVVDDYGTQSGETFWLRGQSPQQHIDSHPNVKFVLERLGEPARSSLPLQYFDVIYSLSTLEHVPTSMLQQVWRHMDALLKPGGEMFHAVDLAFPSNRGLKKVLGAMLFDIFYYLAPRSLQVRWAMATPKAYARLVFQTLGVHYPLEKHLSVLNMILNPDVLSEGYEIGLNRITKDGMVHYRYQRVATLLMRLKKRHD